MWRTARLAIVAAVVALCAGTAGAEPAKPAPQFSFADEVIIARNDALNALLPHDPAGVRKLLDAIAAVKAQPSGRALPKKHRGMDGDGKADGAIRIDPVQNPDLNLLFQRSSPEAAYDLFQILKRVGRQSVVN